MKYIYSYILTYFHNQHNYVKSLPDNFLPDCGITEQGAAEAYALL